MREIRFRVWDKTRDTMLSGNASNIMITLGGLKWWQFGIDEPKPIGNQEDYILMQFTGLQDRKAMAIYEGDILKFDELEWGGPTEGFIVEWDPIYTGFTGDGCTSDWPTYCEVIGNIYESPELKP